MFRISAAHYLLNFGQGTTRPRANALNQIEFLDTTGNNACGSVVLFPGLCAGENVQRHGGHLLTFEGEGHLGELQHLLHHRRHRRHHRRVESFRDLLAELPHAVKGRRRER
jgi:hypothetical protein